MKIAKKIDVEPGRVEDTQQKNPTKVVEASRVGKRQMGRATHDVEIGWPRDSKKRMVKCCSRYFVLESNTGRRLGGEVLSHPQMAIDCRRQRLLLPWIFSLGPREPKPVKSPYRLSEQAHREVAAVSVYA